MRPAERDLLLLLLAAGSGAADAWSYLGLGHTFVANMTGNTAAAKMDAAGSTPTCAGRRRNEKPVSTFTASFAAAFIGNSLN